MIIQGLMPDGVVGRTAVTTTEPGWVDSPRVLPICASRADSRVLYSRTFAAASGAGLALFAFAVAAASRREVLCASFSSLVSSLAIVCSASVPRYFRYCWTNALAHN